MVRCLKSILCNRFTKIHSISPLMTFAQCKLHINKAVLKVMFTNMAVWVTKFCQLASSNRTYAYHSYSTYGVPVRSTALHLTAGSQQMHTLPNTWQKP